MQKNMTISHTLMLLDVRVSLDNNVLVSLPIVTPPNACGTKSQPYYNVQ